jgi:hypothetical protein
MLPLPCPNEGIVAGGSVRGRAVVFHKKHQKRYRFFFAFSWRMGYAGSAT